MRRQECWLHYVDYPLNIVGLILTLGVGNGQYIDVTIKKAVAYSDHDVIWGQGTIRHSNNSDYVECFDSKGFRLEKYINN